MCNRTGFGNCNDITVTDGPGQSDRGCRAALLRGDTCKRRITQQLGAGAAERRISHHRHAVPLAPREQVTFNAPVRDTVRELISRAAIALWNTEEIFHIADLEMGDAPRANLSRRAQFFKRGHNAGEVGDPRWPVQQIEIEMVSTEAFEACLASPRDPVSRHVVGRHLGNQENAFTLTSDCTADKFLGAVNFRRVDQCHSERKASAQRFFFSSLRTFSLSETRRAQAQGRDDSAVTKLYRAPRGS